jgi:hypothetical protein
MGGWCAPGRLMPDRELLMCTHEMGWLSGALAHSVLLNGR